MSKALRILVLSALLVLVTSLSFLVGYGAGQHTIVAAAIAQASPTDVEAPDRFKLLFEVWGWLEKEYLDRESLDVTQLTYGAIRGMLQTLGDPHTHFSDPRERAINESRLQGGFEGIGVFVEMKSDGKLRVTEPQEGSPGEKAGILPGDVITHVDGRSIAGLNLTDAVSLIRGPRGTIVALTLEREGEPEPLDIRVTRESIRTESVQGRMLDQEIAYVRLSSFGAQTARDLVDSLRSLLSQRPAGLVLDLRGNSGGYLNSAVDVASQFLREGVVLYEVRNGGPRQEFRVKPGGVATEIKMVVLVDKGTASASEIVAGALQDQQRALVVGERTFGKGSMQSVRGLSDGSSIYVTIARWLTPNGRPINGSGLIPDVTVERAAGGVAAPDAQMERAIQVVLGDTRQPR